METLSIFNTFRLSFTSQHCGFHLDLESKPFGVWRTNVGLASLALLSSLVLNVTQLPVFWEMITTQDSSPSAFWRCFFLALQLSYTLFVTIGKLNRFKLYFSHAQIGIVLVSTSANTNLVSPWDLTHYILNVKTLPVIFLSVLPNLIIPMSCLWIEISCLNYPWTDHIL